MHREVATSTPAVLQTPVVRYSGYCNTVSFGGNCLSGTQGAWRTGIAGGIRSLSDCQRLCLSCMQCNFVSFSRASGVCAWYDKCSMPLLHSAEGTAFVTTQVVRPTSQSPIDFHVHPLSQATADANWEAARIASATRRFSRQNASELCHIVPRRRFGLPVAPDFLGPSQQLLGNCVPVLQVWPTKSSQDPNGAVHACCALCADTLGCTAWTLLRGGECCLRRWRPERTFLEKSATAGTVRSPCKVDCALHHRPFGRDGVRIPTASAAEIPWLAIGAPAPDDQIRWEQRIRLMGTASRKGASPVAVCVAGQARTIAHPSVARLMRMRLLDNGRHDLFAVLSTGSHGNVLPVGSRFARSVSMQSIDDQCLPEACELAAALQHLRPLRTRFVLNSHEGREPCRENFATIQMVATASCVKLIESYERDQHFRVRYRFMLRTRPDVYWKASLPLDDLTSKLGHRRIVLTTNDWHMLIHRALWTVLRSMDNVTCDQRCNGKRAHYLGTLFDEMNEYCASALPHRPTLPACYHLHGCLRVNATLPMLSLRAGLLLMHFAKHGVEHIEASHPLESGIYHYRADHANAQWLRPMHASNSPLVRWTVPPPKRPLGTRIICHGSQPTCSFCGGAHAPCPTGAVDLDLPRISTGPGATKEAAAVTLDEPFELFSVQNATFDTPPMIVHVQYDPATECVLGETCDCRPDN